MRSFVLALGTVALLSTSACTSVVLYKGPIETLAQGTTDARVAIQTLGAEVNSLAAYNRVYAAAVKSERFDMAMLKPPVPLEYLKARDARCAPTCSRSPRPMQGTPPPSVS